MSVRVARKRRRSAGASERRFASQTRGDLTTRSLIPEFARNSKKCDSAIVLSDAPLILSSRSSKASDVLCRQINELRNSNLSNDHEFHFNANSPATYSILIRIFTSNLADKILHMFIALTSHNTTPPQIPRNR